MFDMRHPAFVAEHFLGNGHNAFVFEYEGTALKLPIREDETNNFAHEKMVYQRIGDHAGIVSVLDMTGEGIQMELMKNGDIRVYLSQHPKPTASMQMYWFLQMATALLHAHDLRVLVADVASRNFLLASDLTVKLSDFGESTILSLDADMQTVDDMGYTIFTDIGQFGSVMYEIIVGQKCEFDLYKIKRTAPATASFPPRDSLPSTHSVWLGDVIESCWTEGSFQSTRDLVTCLESAALGHMSRLKAFGQHIGPHEYVLDYSDNDLSTDGFLSLVARSRQLLRDLGSFSTLKRSAVISGTAHAIEHVCSKGYVPEDIVLSQFLLDEHGSVKLYDVNVSQSTHLDCHTAPESRAKDIVARFGSLMYHIVTGGQPVPYTPPARSALQDAKTTTEGEQEAETSVAFLGQTSERLETSGIHLGGVIDKCWAPDGFQDMTAVCCALSSIVQQESTPSSIYLSGFRAILNFIRGSATLWGFWQS